MKKVILLVLLAIVAGSSAVQAQHTKNEDGEVRKLDENVIAEWDVSDGFVTIYYDLSVELLVSEKGEALSFENTFQLELYFENRDYLIRPKMMSDSDNRWYKLEKY